MIRNMEKQAAEGKRIIEHRRQLDIGAAEITQLMDVYEAAPTALEGVWNLIAAAYYSGLAVGYRNARSDNE